MERYVIVVFPLNLSQIGLYGALQNVKAGMPAICFCILLSFSMMLLFKKLMLANHAKLHYNCNMIDYKFPHSENVPPNCVVDGSI